MIKKVLKHELEVAASADEVWGVYSSPDLPKHLLQILLPGVFEKVEILEGDGGVGTVLLIEFPPGTVPRWYIEKFETIDHKKRLKEVEMIEGGYLDMGCTFYMDIVHVLEKGCNSCVIASKVVYEVPNEEIASKVARYISTEALASMAKVVSNYVLKNRGRKELAHELKVGASPKDQKCNWEVYNSSDLPKLILELLPRVFKDIEIVEGNGGVGTDIRITIPPGLTCSVPVTNKKKFVSWCDRKSFKDWCLYLISAVSLLLMVFLSSRVIGDMFY